jgi:hypothetical protein
MADDVPASMTQSVGARGRRNKASGHSGMPTTRLAGMGLRACFPGVDSHLKMSDQRASGW